jgi:formate dehydrogenase iron-sulfur subunit
MSDAIRIYVPRDAAAVSLGADDVADRLAAAAKKNETAIDIIRNGSWGMTWLEPMVEIDSNSQRIAYGPVTPGDVDDLVAAGFFDAADHDLKLGPTADIDWLKDQDRWTFRRCGLIDPLSINDYLANGGFEGLKIAFEKGASHVLQEVTASGLRGRGGAGFPTGIKWQTVADAEGDQKYIACNADEGDSGTYSDRILMESDPLMLIEGMLIAGFAVGANKAYVYLRAEYPLTRQIFSKALALARDNGWLGKNIQGSGFDFEIDLHIGAGSYVCGEETAMLESLEGKAGVIRYRPPLPAIEGLFGKPTVVNNVVTLGSVPDILPRAHWLSSLPEISNAADW